MKTLRYETNREKLEIVHDFYKVVEQSKINMDISFILDSELAIFMYESLGYSDSLLMKESDFENDFGYLTGKCLLTIFKENNKIQVVAEEACRVNDGIIEPKYHEVDTLVIFAEDIELIQKYEVRKAIIFDCDTELKKIEELLLN